MKTQTLDVSAQNLKRGDVFHDPMVDLRVVQMWSTVVGPGAWVSTRIIHVIWEHLDIDVRIQTQHTPGQRFVIERSVTE